MLRMSFAAAAFSLWLPTVAMAGHDVLKIGDRAPDLDVAHWVKGSEIEEFESGRIYVVEFWATWCVPCRAAIPHVSELQEKYADYNVTFVGVSDEKLQTVVKFLTKSDSSDMLWTEKMRYTVGADPDRTTADQFMRAAGQETIPTAFIIGRDRRVEWIGYTTDIDEVLAKVVRDRWDRTAFGIEYEKEVAPVRKMFRLLDDVDDAAEQQDWAAAQAAVQKLIDEQPGYERLKARLFRKMLHSADDRAATFAYGRDLMREYWDDARLLNSLAWFTVDDEKALSRDLDFAIEAARRASALTDDADPAILDTVGRAYFENGDLENAVKWQGLAVETAEDTPYYDSVLEALEKYKKLAGADL